MLFFFIFFFCFCGKYFKRVILLISFFCYIVICYCSNTFYEKKKKYLVGLFTKEVHLTVSK